MQLRNLLAIDPSLTCSGWALFEIQEERLLGVGKIRSLPSTHLLADRLFDLHTKVDGTLTELSLSGNDVLICESPTTMRDPHAAIKVERVRGIFEGLAHVRSVRVPGRINPRSVQFEVLGLRGKQAVREIVKQTAVGAVQKLFERDLKKLQFPCDLDGLSKHQDIVDAILVGHLALARIKSALRSGAPIEEMFVEKRTPRSSGWRKLAGGMG